MACISKFKRGEARKIETFIYLLIQFIWDQLQVLFVSKEKTKKKHTKPHLKFKQI